MSSRVFPAIALVIAILLATACRSGPGDIVRKDPKFFTAADEAKIGQRLVDESWRDGSRSIIQDGTGTFTDEAYAYLKPLLYQLVDQQHVTRRDSFSWDLHMVVDRTSHAYTLPGGQLMLHTGLLHSLHSEAEFVGILAREVALAETGAAMAALDRNVEDNVLLGDLILGNDAILDDVIDELPGLNFTEAELYAADSLAARLVCPSDYEEQGLTLAVERFDTDAPYLRTRPAERFWASTFESRVSSCPGADSLYAHRYIDQLGRYVPN